jgi:hypothetical protein
MCRILLAIAFMLAGSCVWAEEPSPDRFIEEVISAFNSENVADYQAKFHYPNSRIINGQIEIFDNKNIPAINFSNLKKTGWVRSSNQRAANSCDRRSVGNSETELRSD